MADYRDPKLTATGRTNTGGGMGRWLGIAAGAIVLLLLLSWLLGWFGGEDIDTAAPVATEESQVLQGEETGTIEGAGEGGTTVVD
jgi:hypothetical protein